MRDHPSQSGGKIVFGIRVYCRLPAVHDLYVSAASCPASLCVQQLQASKAAVVQQVTEQQQLTAQPACTEQQQAMSSGDEDQAKQVKVRTPSSYTGALRVTTQLRDPPPPPPFAIRVRTGAHGRPHRLHLQPAGAVVPAAQLPLFLAAEWLLIGSSTHPW